MYVCSVSFVLSSAFVGSSGSLSIVAMFLISSPLSRSFTVTLNSMSLLSPASKSTFIPFDKSVAFSPSWTSSFTLILPATNVVPSGISSFTITLIGAVPVVLSKCIVYVISSPSFTVFPLAGFDVLLYCKFDLFTVVSVSFVGSSSLSGSSGALFIVATFLIVAVNVSPSSSFTVTSKLTVTSPAVASVVAPPWFAPPAVSLLAGTVTVIPFARSSAVISSWASSFIFMLPFTNVVPSGMLSFTTTSPAKSPLFCTLIVYVIFSPSTI